mmetsp:Transcript_7832/g.12109  ORF Transcript_7832/g.12109 Transcript_7832/m.12109 type:complete len:107 (-) Transcript_7832:25-345(-)
MRMQLEITLNLLQNVMTGAMLVTTNRCTYAEALEKKYILCTTKCCKTLFLMLIRMHHHLRAEQQRRSTGTGNRKMSFRTSNRLLLGLSASLVPLLYQTCRVEYNLF